MSDICSTEFLENWLAARPAGAVVSHGRLPLGEQVGEWRVEAYLGAGISAEVYRVVNTRTGRDGALKLLVDQSKGLGARFTEEMDAMRFLHLSCLPTFYGNGTFRGRPYFVMEYLQPLLLPLPRPAEIPPEEEMAAPEPTSAQGEATNTEKTENLFVKSSSQTAESVVE